MERLFTNITNAGATAAQNENIMHTGCYAGERENFMRENLFMTETTMVPVKIALDHGWSSIKGEHIFMETSVVPVQASQDKPSHTVHAPGSCSVKLQESCAHSPLWQPQHPLPSW